MRAFLKTLHVQKLGNDISEFEDAFEPTVDQIIESTEAFLAVADGATESSFSATWAKLLVFRLLTVQPTSVKELRQAVAQSIRIWKRIVYKKPLPWYAEEKVRLGSHSTIPGVKFYCGEQHHWNALSVGDTCFFQIRKDTVATAFPIGCSTEFGNAALLLSTDMSYNENVWPQVAFFRGSWETRDTFLLMTDALAQWFLHQAEQQNRPWVTLRGFVHDDAGQDHFADWIEELRGSHRIRNDDVTLLALTEIEE